MLATIRLDKSKNQQARPTTLRRNPELDRKHIAHYQIGRILREHILGTNHFSADSEDYDKLTTLSMKGFRGRTLLLTAPLVLVLSPEATPFHNTFPAKSGMKEIRRNIID